MYVLSLRGMNECAHYAASTQRKGKNIETLSYAKRNGFGRSSFTSRHLYRIHISYKNFLILLRNETKRMNDMETEEMWINCRGMNVWILAEKQFNDWNATMNFKKLFKLLMKGFISISFFDQFQITINKKINETDLLRIEIKT